MTAIGIRTRSRCCVTPDNMGEREGREGEDKMVGGEKRPLQGEIAEQTADKREED